MLIRLPEDVQVDVFLRLPVKSIQICRCVCKPLCKLLYNPKFIKDFNHNCMRNPRLMFICDPENRGPICRSIDYASISSASASSTTRYICDGVIPMENPGHNEWSPGFNVVGSCGGLICVSLYGSATFCIWNPSTGEHKKLKLFDPIFCPVFCGFGYDSHLNDYKVVRIVADEKDGGCSQVEVCTLGRILNPWTIQTPKRYTLCDFYSCLLNGALHWPGLIKATGSNIIVSFDISSERFVEFGYPEKVVYLQMANSLGPLEDRLGMIAFSEYVFDSIDVWLMQDYGVGESWTKQFSFKPSCLVNHPYLKLVWSFTNGEILMESGYTKFVYDPKSELTKALEGPGFLNDKYGWSLPVSYVDSLVSLATCSGKRKANGVGCIIPKKQRQN